MYNRYQVYYLYQEVACNTKRDNQEVERQNPPSPGQRSMSIHLFLTPKMNANEVVLYSRPRVRV